MSDDLIRVDNPETRSLAARLVGDGEVIAFRTDTFYGLGANPFDDDAVRKVAELKGRADDKPILVLISDYEVARKFIAAESAVFRRLAEAFWAGEVTIVEKAKPSLNRHLTRAGETIGLRLPRSSEVRKLIDSCGGALTGTSANPSGAAPASTARQVADYFQSGVSLIVDGGDACTTQPSTIVDVSDGVARLIREGVISRDELSQVVDVVG